MIRCSHGYDAPYCPVCWVNAPPPLVIVWVTQEEVSHD